MGKFPIPKPLIKLDIFCLIAKICNNKLNGLIDSITNKFANMIPKANLSGPLSAAGDSINAVTEGIGKSVGVVITTPLRLIAMVTSFFAGFLKIFLIITAIFFIIWLIKKLISIIKNIFKKIGQEKEGKADETTQKEEIQTNSNEKTESSNDVRAFD